MKGLKEKLLRKKKKNKTQMRKNNCLEKPHKPTSPQVPSLMEGCKEYNTNNVFPQDPKQHYISTTLKMMQKEQKQKKISNSKETSENTRPIDLTYSPGQLTG